MMYTLDHYCCFNWYHWIYLFFSIGINFDLSCILIYVCMYVCFHFKWYQCQLVSNFPYIYMYFICAYYISISLSTNFGYAKLDFLNDNYISIDYFSIGILYKLMHHFVWYFIKGEKIHISPFNWFCLPSIFYSHTLCWKMIEKWYWLFFVSYAPNEKLLSIGTNLYNRYQDYLYVYIIQLILKFLVEFFKMIYLLTIEFL